MPDPTIRQLRERELGPTTAMLARAFMEAPLTQVLAPDRARRDAASRWLFGSHLRYARRWGEAWAAVGPGRAITGASIWWAPEYVEPDDERSEESGLADGLLVVGPTAWGQLAELGRAMSELHQRSAPDVHWYLAVLGVDPSARGHGLAGQILSPMLDRLDAERLPAYLETGNPQNLTYYPRYGFEVVGEVEIPGVGLTFWGMRREPR
jgi:ribosomal protein S18 acetylase RimI-like enzyme